jgi:uncharacterized membrane protein YfcA
MSNSERAIGAIAVGTAVMAAIYLVRRSREGELDWRRDALWVAGLIGVAVVAIAVVFTAPGALVSLAIPAILILGGCYLVRNNEQGSTRTLGWLAVAAGLSAAILGLIRLFLLN